MKLNQVPRASGIGAYGSVVHGDPRVALRQCRKTGAPAGAPAMEPATTRLPGGPNPLLSRSAIQEIGPHSRRAPCPSYVQAPYTAGEEERWNSHASARSRSGTRAYQVPGASGGNVTAALDCPARNESCFHAVWRDAFRQRRYTVLSRHSSSTAPPARSVPRGSPGAGQIAASGEQGELAPLPLYSHRAIGR